MSECVKKLYKWKDQKLYWQTEKKKKLRPVSHSCSTFHHCWLHTAQFNKLGSICHVVSDPGAEGSRPHLSSSASPPAAVAGWCCPNENERAAPGRWWHCSNLGVAGRSTVEGPLMTSTVVWGMTTPASLAPSSHGMSEQLAGLWDETGTYSLPCCLGWTLGVGWLILLLILS